VDPAAARHHDQSVQAWAQRCSEGLLASQREALLWRTARWREDPILAACGV
jgi:hypothetical protein